MTTVVAAVIERAGNILIAQRKNEGPHALKWEFPGGKVEPGETPEAALRRELEEELGIDAQIGNEITRYEYSYPSRAPILLIFFKVDGFDGDPRNLAFAQIQWTQRDRIRDYDFLEGDTEFIRLLKS